MRGVAVDWAAVARPRASVVELPTYAFQHQRFWPAAARCERRRSGGGRCRSGGRGPVLGRGRGRRPGSAGRRRWRWTDQRPLGEVLPALASWRRRERDESADRRAGGTGSPGRRSPSSPRPAACPAPGWSWSPVRRGAATWPAPAGPALTGARRPRRRRRGRPGGTDRHAGRPDRRAGPSTAAAAGTGRCPGRPVWCRCWRSQEAPLAGVRGRAARAWPAPWPWCRRWATRRSEAPLWVLTRGAVAAGASGDVGQPGAGTGLGPGPGGRPRAPGPVGRPDRPARRCSTSRAAGPAVRGAGRVR